MQLVCYGFCIQDVTALKGISSNIKWEDGKWKIILTKHSIPSSDLVSFLNEGDCLGFGTCAAMLGHHSSALGWSAGTTILRGRRPSYLVSNFLSDSAIRCNIQRQRRWFLSWRLPGIFLQRTGMETRK